MAFPFTRPDYHDYDADAVSMMIDDGDRTFLAQGPTCKTIFLILYLPQQRQSAFCAPTTGVARERIRKYASSLFPVALKFSSPPLQCITWSGFPRGSVVKIDELDVPTYDPQTNAFM